MAYRDYRRRCISGIRGLIMTTELQYAYLLKLLTDVEQGKTTAQEAYNYIITAWEAINPDPYPGEV